MMRPALVTQPCDDGLQNGVDALGNAASGVCAKGFVNRR